MIRWFLILIVCLNGHLPYQPLKHPRIKTPISTVNLAYVLRKGHLEIFKTDSSTKRLAMGWAQVALENAQGQEIYNYNLGNVGSRGTVPYYVIGGNKFLANNNFLEGAKRYWETLKNMCPSSLTYFDAGDPIGAALQLRRCGYYQADTKIYSHVMKQLFYSAIKHVINNMTNNPVNLQIQPNLTSQGSQVILWK